jgi:nucleotide-binding universal stress UspA family protein
VAEIVVGVDASPGALRALAWAADEARLRLASLEVVHADHARPPEEEMTEAVDQKAESQDAVRRQAEDLLEGRLLEVGETVEGIEDPKAAAPPRVEPSEVDS